MDIGDLDWVVREDYIQKLDWDCYINQRGQVIGA